jgi:hypothetical protein
MCIESLGDGGGVIDRHVARAADGQIDDEILDHDPFSGWRPGRMTARPHRFMLRSFPRLLR